MIPCACVLCGTTLQQAVGIFADSADSEQVSMGKILADLYSLLTICYFLFCLELLVGIETYKCKYKWLTHVM